MKIKLLLFGSFLLFLFASCSKEDDNAIPTGEPVMFTLNFTPTLEVTQDDITNGTRQSYSGLYAINVLWKGKSLTAFEPYATGLFNDISDVSIGLIEGYDYRFDCAFFPDTDLPYSEDGKYGLPLSRTPDKKIDGVVTNKLEVSIAGLWENQNFYQFIYEGATQVSADKIANRPSNYRFFGSAWVDFKYKQPGQTVINCDLELMRAYYYLEFLCEGLDPDDKLKIEIEGSEPFQMTGTSSSITYSEQRLMVMEKLSTRYNGGVYGSEQLLMKIKYLPAGEEEWQTINESARIEVIRNNINHIKIVNIGDYKSSPSIYFEGGSWIPTHINEKEIEL